MRRLTKTWIWLVVALVTAIGVAGQDYPRYRAAGSTFVPLDSWMYPALERLAARGYVRTAMLGMKPWTRIECARLTDEAADQIREAVLNDERVEDPLLQVQAALEREFALELDVLGGGRTRSVRLESVYARVTSISGPPLTDGLHFGQTVSYDFGRPFRRGTNAIAGGAFRATAGPFAFYIRGEYQHGPSAPPVSDAVLDFIAAIDAKPREQARRFPAINRGRLLDAYLAVNIRNWQLSFGKQALSWGGGGGIQGDSLLLSNNVDPLWMMRASRVVPHRLPGFLRYFGPVRAEFFFSRAEGGTVVRRPYFYGNRISIKPHPRFEVGFGHTVLIGGRGGVPLTTRSFFRSLIGVTAKPSDPGDSRISMDFNWRLPWFGDSVVAYGEFFQDDEPAPFVNPGKAAIRPGLYFRRLPGLPKLDFRLEAASTESHSSHPNGGRLNYWNGQYRDGYTSRGVLLGNTVGRDGRNIQLSSNYWFSPEQILQFSFKQSMVRREFVPGGGGWQDYAVRYERRMRSGLYVRGSLQYEHIGRFPLLFPGSRNNVTTSVELGLVPEQTKP